MNKERCPVILAIVALVTLLVVASCAYNGLPIITSLEPEAPGWTAPLGSLEVTCTASDPEGGPLSYEWSATGGNITGTGAMVNWTAPQEVGMYDVTVVAEDSLGASAANVVALIASNGPPPAIEDLNVTAIGHPYLKETTFGYKVAKTYNYTVECTATGNGTLSYNWTCTDGNIAGEGSVINWTAPATEGYVTVTVKVFDGADNWVRGSILFQVVSCTSCGTW